ncbi:MAG: hypothetical protein E6G56_14735 [Actinobacteria bacterium]|nr:MAG: hypothetical protein E6G56_14735 [Actinomycetota bacterium]
MTSTEQRDAERTARQGRKGRNEQRRAIAAQRRLTHHRDRAHKPSHRPTGPRYPYLTHSHD